MKGSSFQLGPVFDPDTFYAGDTFASKQDDSYYGGDSYVSLPPLISAPLQRRNFLPSFLPSRKGLQKNIVPNSIFGLAEAAGELLIFSTLRYGAPLSPVLSSAPAAYDYGTSGWVLPTG